MGSTPLVTAILPCYNAERFVDAAVGSLLAQTYTELEILCIDDGSTDGTAARLEVLAATDQRVRLLSAGRNQGLIAALNWGVREASGDFIARLDADDVALPSRIARQVETLTTRTDLGIVGTAVVLVDPEGRPLRRPPELRCYEPAGARFTSLFANPLHHPTILARTELLRSHQYGVGSHSLHTEDYDLWARLIASGARVSNFPEPLTMKRRGETNVSVLHESAQVENFVLSALEQYRRLCGTEPPAGAHRVFVNRMTATTTPQDLDDGLALLDLAERDALEASPSEASDIRRSADMHRTDILLQALLRGSRQMQIRAGRLTTRYVRQITSPVSRSYLRSKLSR